MTHRVSNFAESKLVEIYIKNVRQLIMKTTCPPGYHHNSYVATHALGRMM